MHVLESTIIFKRSSIIRQCKINETFIEEFILFPTMDTNDRKRSLTDSNRQHQDKRQKLEDCRETYEIRNSDAMQSTSNPFDNQGDPTQSTGVSLDVQKSRYLAGNCNAQHALPQTGRFPATNVQEKSHLQIQNTQEGEITQNEQGGNDNEEEEKKQEEQEEKEQTGNEYNRDDSVDSDAKEDVERQLAT